MRRPRNGKLLKSGPSQGPHGQITRRSHVGSRTGRGTDKESWKRAEEESCTDPDADAERHSEIQDAIKPHGRQNKHGYVESLEGQSVGASLQSYRFDGRLWAVPIDAAAQVAAWRPDLLDRPPASWPEVLDLARRRRLILPMSPTDAYATFFTLVSSTGGEVPVDQETLISAHDAHPALALLTEILAYLPPEALRLTPITTLDVLSRTNEYAYCPFLFGYSNYARSGFRPRLVRFSDAVPVTPAHPARTMLGGTGLAISNRSPSQAAADEFLSWVASSGVQRGSYFAGGGQPAHVDAWDDPSFDAAAHGFFRDTRATLERSWMRPTHPGFGSFQTHAMVLVHGALTGGWDADATSERLNGAYRTVLGRIAGTSGHARG